jgi:hypothetical protein
MLEMVVVNLILKFKKNIMTNLLKIMFIKYIYKNVYVLMEAIITH